MKVKIKNSYYYWWERAYYTYRLTHLSVVLINGRYYNLDGFDGKLARVHLDGSLVRFSISKIRKPRYDAIVTRMTMCNKINKHEKYKFDIKDDRCQFCYIYIPCRASKMGLGIFDPSYDHKAARVKLCLRDMAVVSKFIADNEDLTYET